MKEQLNLFVESSRQFLNEIAVALPQIIGALLILLIGWIIAKVVKRLSIKGLKAGQIQLPDRKIRNRKVP